VGSTCVQARNSNPQLARKSSSGENMKRPYRLALAGLLAATANASTQAQSPDPPATYSLTETNAFFGPALTVQVYRDGDMVLLDSSQDAGSTLTIATHTRTLFDLRAGKSYALDLVNLSSPCGVSIFSGDWGDPFTLSAGITGDISKRNPKTLGQDKVAGFPANVVEVPDPDGTGKYKVWLDQKYGFILKMQLIPGSGSPQTLIEIKQLSFEKPQASLFTVPQPCAQAAAAPVQPTLTERIATETGGKPSDYVNATFPAESGNSCAVLFKVVEAGTLQPVPTGFQVALDTQIDVAHRASYTTGTDASGRVTYSGGHIQELTGQMQNGVLRIDNAPSQFNIEVSFGNAGTSSALIYRQCFGPETTLLLVLSNPQKLSDGGDWLWAKKP